MKQFSHFFASMLLILCLTANLHAQNLFRTHYPIGTYFDTIPPLQWTYLYGTSVQPTQDGNYTFSHSRGYVYLDGNAFLTKPYVIKADSNFNCLWTKQLIGGDKVQTFSMEDSTFIFFTKGKQGACIEKTDNQGNTIWAKRFAAHDAYIGNSFAIYRGNGIFNVAIAYTPKDPTFHIDTYTLLAKIDTSGNVLSLKELQNPAGSWLEARAYKADNVGNALLITHDYTTVYTNDYFRATKLDSNQNKIWEIRFHQDSLQIYDILCVANNSFILLGKRASDICLAKIDQNANVLWTRRMANLPYNYTTGVDLKYIQAPYFLMTFKDKVLKIDENTGNIITGKVYNNLNYLCTPFIKSYNDWIYHAYFVDTLHNTMFNTVFNTFSNGIASCMSGSYMPINSATPISPSNVGLVPSTTFITAFDSIVQVPYYPPQSLLNYNGCLPPANVPLEIEHSYSFSTPTLQLFPNPAESKLYFTLCNTKLIINRIRIIDISGKEIYSENIENKDFIDISFLQNGMYYLQIISQNESYSKVFVKSK